MFRIWCLYEYYVMLKSNFRHEFVMLPEQYDSFIQLLGIEGSGFLDLASKLDMQNAEAYSAFDKKQILRLVMKDLGGFSQVNEGTTGAIREFCIESSISALRNMDPAQK
jgi:hypothetical protein